MNTSSNANTEKWAKCGTRCLALVAGRRPEHDAPAVRPRFLGRLDPATVAVILLVILALITTLRAKDIAPADAPSARVGYLQVYSATDESNDGGTLYYAHSSYSIYTTGGKLFKKVENHISPTDEIPTLVTLPTGAYMIEVRSESHGYVRVPIVVTADRRIAIDPDKEQTETGKRKVTSSTRFVLQASKETDSPRSRN